MDGTPESLGEDGGIVEEERHEGTVFPVSAVGDEEVEVRVPVQQGAEGLDASDDAGTAAGSRREARRNSRRVTQATRLRSPRRRRSK